MSQERLDKLRHVYHAFNRGDFDEAVTVLHRDVEFLPPGGRVVYRGPQSVRAWMEPDALVDQSIEAVEFTVAGTKILVRQRVRARGASTGLELDAYSWAVYTFGEDGLVIRVEGYMEHDEAEAREAAGLQE
jgi:ketosteroid isomerase-like protein